MKENTAPGSAGAVRVGDRGVPGSGGFCELNLAGSERTLPGGPAWVQGSVLETAEPRGGAESRKFATGTAPPRLEQPLVGKPGAGALAAESRSASPPRGSPSLSSGVERCSKPARGHPGPFASFPRGLAPASQPAAGASHSLRGPRSEGARLQPRLPGSGGSGIARRLQGGRPPGKLEGLSRLATPQDRLSQQFAKIIRQNPEVTPLAVHIRKEDAAQPGAWAGNPHPPSERKEARKVSKRLSWARNLMNYFREGELKRTRRHFPPRQSLSNCLFFSQTVCL
ncbi:hypothetical protein mRhiFer1_009190 [Rhinolophus ferrumequinum]|uniref:Uncharacterized protein n=1 Tax=Rhinolophus ferrumequinum TaxID=59479 RepID=A0A7J7SJK4_RHIFE|nr:hypothetical protein mRhiFer1_009190 [Rhinolophus ferrumequinum]